MCVCVCVCVCVCIKREIYDLREREREIGDLREILMTSEREREREIGDLRERERDW